MGVLIILILVIILQTCVCAYHIITLYPLNMHNYICQFLNKVEGKIMSVLGKIYTYNLTNTNFPIFCPDLLSVHSEIDFVFLMVLFLIVLNWNNPAWWSFILLLEISLQIKCSSFDICFNVALSIPYWNSILQHCSLLNLVVKSESHLSYLSM